MTMIGLWRVKKKDCYGGGLETDLTILHFHYF